MDHSSGTLQSPSTYSESSKTTSSKSAASADKKTLSEDNVVSFIDLECHIQAERIKKILDEAIYKSKLALCLPNLVKEYTALSCVLSSQHMDDLVFIFEQYDNPMFSNSLMNVEALDDIKSLPFMLSPSHLPTDT
ncbi:L-alanine-DL-glutamate epimerase related enzymes of enolase superfamily [Operophtera brumata]|uniref:L-alanine-DL-glutamate epimerase related enzymes of enolase superfamily n=1 Tax=Operophtera brumata TaxID=104452 RepID=A0A0L7LU56_OPEBR|nr:L-alanine-DL-glutamate epimerase related enzymes of enolase superfamily [Operophtera brumata]